LGQGDYQGDQKREGIERADQGFRETFGRKDKGGGKKWVAYIKEVRFGIFNIIRMAGQLERLPKQAQRLRPGSY
jgi:hypothetical protein